MIPGERTFSFVSDGLELEGMLHEGEGQLAAVVLHPHPVYGGDMDNHVVLALRAAFAEAGATTLRFNFRGAGRSQGAHDGGRGEADDARAAMRELRTLRPGCGMLLAGYSFGAQVACAVASTEQLAGLVLVSPPAATVALPRLPEGVDTLIVTGEWDDVAPAERLAELAGPRRRLAVVEGASHAWWPGVDQLAAEVAAFLGELPRD
ncbi:MAG: alpha/beta hydrolase [Dehalococcoidia bacterium]|nr:MAG: alpha/beta hydrolase [Dehalococcoidia bacterium]